MPLLNVVDYWYSLALEHAGTRVHRERLARPTMHLDGLR